MEIQKIRQNPQLQTVLYLIEKFFPWGMTVTKLLGSTCFGLGMYFVSWIFLDVVSKFKSIRRLKNEKTEAEKKESEKKKFLSQSVPCSGLTDVLLKYPDSSGKHINKNSIVSRYPIQRYTVADLVKDIEIKEARIKELTVLNENDFHLVVSNRAKLLDLCLKSNEEEKIRIQAEERLMLMQQKLEKIKKEESDCNIIKSDINKGIDQLTQITEFVKEMAIGMDQETKALKLQRLKENMEMKLDEDKTILELQAIHYQLLKQKDEDRVRKDRLLQQVVRMKNNQSYNYSMIYESFSDENEEKEEKEEKTTYGFSLPPTYVNLENSVVSLPQPIYKDNTAIMMNYDSTDDFFSCSESEYFDD